MDLKHKLSLGHRSFDIEKLKEVVYLAEKRTPLESDCQYFSNDEVGSLLNRFAKAYDRLSREQSHLSKAQEEAVMERQEQIRNKVRLTHNINHELKTPISSIKGYLETMINNPEMDPQQQKTFLLKCYQQTERLTTLLQDLSVITRMDEGRELIEKEPLSLSLIITEAVREKEKEAEEKGIKIINMMPDNLLIQGNRSLLQSIFHNLIDNAILYSGGTEIKIFLESQTEEYYQIVFADNGVGIGEEHLGKIFERFYRVDKGRSRKLGGTGLGLSIVKNAVVIHGGTIVALCGKNKGLEFNFTLYKV